MEYREGLNVGYRYFDSADVPVLFPFGHGLSYTKFEYSDLQATLLDEFCAHIKFTLGNVGSVRAAEIVQCYVHDVETTVYRPQQELKAFSKFWLDPGEHQNVEFTLDKDAFTFYDVGHKTWIVEPGNFQIRVGASSRDVRLQARIHISAGQAASQLARKAHPPFPHIPGQVTDEAFLQMLGTESLPMPNNKIRPYHRNSLMAELKHSMMGRLVRRQGHRVAIAEMENADDPAQRRMVKELVDNMPLRGLVIFSQGELLFEDLDTLIAFLNLRFLKTILHIGPVIKRRCRKSKEHHEPLGMILMEAIDA
jgi:beta-glucosidase